MSRLSARTVSIVLAVVTGVYLTVIAQRAWSLMTSGSAVAFILGVAIMVLPVIGVWVIWRELQFGFRTAELGRILDRAGELPADDLPRRPSGRVEREAADTRFAERRAEVEAAPEDWGAWFRLGVAYDDAGDRRRARAAMRTAIAKYRGH
ncbi:MAG: hypothetical protein ACJ72Y_10140 [Actinomycetes bacterium]